MNITLNIPINSTTKPNHEIAKVLRDLANAFEPGTIANDTINALANIKESTSEHPKFWPNLPTDAPVEYTLDQITNQLMDYADQYGLEAVVKILNAFKIKEVADLKPEAYANFMKALGA